MRNVLMASAFSLLFISCFGREKHLEVGDKVPVFSLKDQDGKTFNISDFIGKKMLVVYFYPKDETSVCTKEACLFRDHFTDFTSAGAMVIGINSGSVESHKSFQQNHNLPFTLLSDPGNKVLKMFGVRNKVVITGRETFVVDLSGKIVYTFADMRDAQGHVQKALDYIKAHQH